jgi:hypothetical protein
MVMVPAGEVVGVRFDPGAWLVVDGVDVDGCCGTIDVDGCCGVIDDVMIPGGESGIVDGEVGTEASLVGATVGGADTSVVGQSPGVDVGFEFVVGSTGEVAGGVAGFVVRGNEAEVNAGAVDGSVRDCVLEVAVEPVGPGIVVGPS